MFCFLIAAILEFTPQDANYSYEKAKEFVKTCTPRDSGTIRGSIAANYILDNTSAAGADIRRDVFTANTPKGQKNFVNLYAEFKGEDKDARWVVLLSHYDTKSGVDCPGANDGASTTALLMGIANAAMRCDVLKGNLLLVWTDGEECINNYGSDDGLWGARRALKYVQERGYKVQAVINLDMLGDKDLSISIPANGTPALAKIAEHAARRAGYPELVKSIPETVTDDYVVFLEAGYKAVGLIDFNYGPKNSYWHSSDDTIDKISEESLLKSGKIAVEMINILM